VVNLINQFADDPTVIALAVLVGLDLVLGVSAAVKNGVFRLSYVADVLRNDVLGKVIPYYAVWAAVHISGDVMISDFGVIEETAGGLAVAAVGGSVFNSLRDLGLWDKAPDAIAGPDPQSGVDSSPPPQ
jgi:hypothetical protein